MGKGDLKAYFFRLLCFFCLLFLSCALISCEKAVDSRWKSAKSENSVEAYKAYLKEFPDSVHAQKARFALARLWEAGKNYDKIIAYFSAYAQADPQDMMSRYSVKVAELEKTKKQATSQYEASVRGDMKPMEGLMGLVYPTLGAFKVDGEAHSTLDKAKFSAKITAPAILYADMKQTKKVGWGVVATSGELVIPTADYTALKAGKLPYYVESVFDAAPLDYLNRYTRITIRADRQHKFVIPASLFSQYHTGTSHLAPGSVFEISTSAKDVDSGLWAEILTGTPDNRVDLYTVCYRTDGGIHRVGMRIGEKGEKLIYGAEHLTYTALDKSAVGGTVNCRMQ